MNAFFTIIKSDYLQRTRSYAFLITLCATLAIAYTFVPEPNANYSTIKVANYVGYYNSAWFGYVTAVMTSIFLSLFGFYLVNNSIETDVKTKVGQIVAATSISNFKYLLSKVLSNFLVLLTIVLMVFAMSIILFISYNDGYPFELNQFIKPYVIIVLPALFFIAVVALVFEIFFGKYSVLQNLTFFFVFMVLIIFTPSSELEHSFDVLGSKIVMQDIEHSVREITKMPEEVDFNMGYVSDNTKKASKFEFKGVDFPISFILSRFAWIVFGMLIVYFISFLFHRFNLKERRFKRKVHSEIITSEFLKEVNLVSLPTATIDYGIFPLLKTELTLLFRKGRKWLWLINIGGMVLLALLPLKMTHQIVLPILWFLQVGRLSDLTTKESSNNIHYFAFASYKPISRLLVSQIVAAIIIILTLTLPLLFRLGLTLNFSGVTAIILGGIFVVLTAALLGILSKGKKLFEVLFFMVTYANINGISFVDYFGAFEHRQFYIFQMIILIIAFAISLVLKRKYQLEG